MAFLIRGPKKSVLYLPDIDRWEAWDTRIEDVLKKVNSLKQEIIAGKIQVPDYYKRNAKN